MERRKIFTELVVTLAMMLFFNGNTAIATNLLANPIVTEAATKTVEANKADTKKAAKPVIAKVQKSQIKINTKKVSLKKKGAVKTIKILNGKEIRQKYKIRFGKLTTSNKKQVTIFGKDQKLLKFKIKAKKANVDNVKIKVPVLAKNGKTIKIFVTKVSVKTANNSVDNSTGNTDADGTNSTDGTDNTGANNATNDGTGTGTTDTDSTKPEDQDDKKDQDKTDGSSSGSTPGSTWSPINPGNPGNPVIPSQPNRPNKPGDGESNNGGSDSKPPVKPVDPLPPVVNPDPEPVDPDIPTGPAITPTPPALDADTSEWALIADNKEYDRSTVTIQPTGIPSNVITRLEYTKDGQIVDKAIDAGVYTCTAYFTMPEGYNPVAPMSVQFEIKPRKLSLALEFDGKYDIVTARHSLLQGDGVVTVVCDGVVQAGNQAILEDLGRHHVAAEVKLTDRAQQNYEYSEASLKAEKGYYLKTAYNWGKVETVVSHEGGNTSVRIYVCDMKLPLYDIANGSSRYVQIDGNIKTGLTYSQTRNDLVHIGENASTNWDSYYRTSTKQFQSKCYINNGKDPSGSRICLGTIRFQGEGEVKLENMRFTIYPHTNLPFSFLMTADDESAAGEIVYSERSPLSMVVPKGGNPNIGTNELDALKAFAESTFGIEL